MPGGPALFARRAVSGPGLCIAAPEVIRRAQRCRCRRTSDFSGCTRAGLPSGPHTEMASNGRGKGGTSTLYINDKKVASRRVEQTNAKVSSADDAADVGVAKGRR